MEEGSEPIAVLVRTEGAQDNVPPMVTFTAQTASISVGRLESNNVVLNDRKISKVHARLSLRACKRKSGSETEIMKRLFVKDSSTFGTFVNGRALTKETWVLLQEGDVIGLRNPHGNASLGEYRVQYSEDGGGQPAKPQQASPPSAASPGSPISEVKGLPPVAVKVEPPAADPLYAEPLSPLSEVSEVSAPDDEAEAEQSQGAGPGLLLRMHGAESVPMASLGLGGRPPLPGMHGFRPPGALPRGPLFPSPCGIGMGSTLLDAPGAITLVRPSASASGAAALPSPAAASPPPTVTMKVQAELIGMLIGKGGETVKQLSKDSGARIEISKTGTDGSDGERQVFLSGSTECVDRAKQMIEETLSKARENTVKSNPNAFVMKVPHELVGMLIGRGGETIKELKKESGARIDISKEPTDSSANDRLVHISGPPECVEFAKKQVEEMLGRGRERRSADFEPRPRSATPDPNRITQTTVKVPHELIGMLIGKNGETIRGISHDSGCRIEIAKDESSQKEAQRAVHLRGTMESLERAKRMMEDTLNRSRERRGGEIILDLGVRRDSGGPGPRVIHVPPELVGMLIGKGGETIKEISQDTRARIEIAKEDREGMDRTVTISGDPEAIDKAQEAIDDVLDRAREKLGLRCERRRGRSPGRLEEDGGEDLRRSPIKDSYLSEKIYVDEVDMPFRPNFMLEHEDGLPTDLELFIRGLPTACAERDLWEHLYRMGATDVKEILLLRRKGQSKGMAYVVFNRHDHAVMAKVKLQNAPTASIPCGGKLLPDERGHVLVRFSESERCINGRSNVYGVDMVGLQLGSKGKCMEMVKRESGLRKVILTGRNMQSYGRVDEDPRLHMVVYYEPDEADRANKAIAVWGEQLAKIHREIAEKVVVDKGQGKGKGWPAWGPMPPAWPRPMPFPGYPPGVPLSRPPVPPMDFHQVEAPVFVQRRRLKLDEEDMDAPGAPSCVKILEATSLQGRELRWQPWPAVTRFNEEWKALPMRWGLRSELFVLLRRRGTGEARVCAAEVHLPLEKWPVLRSATMAPTPSARYKSFTFNEHLFIVVFDHEQDVMQVFHVPDPSSPWDVAFQMPLGSEELRISPTSKLCFFYAQDRAPHVVVVDPKSTPQDAVRVFRIVDPGKPWERCAQAPQLPPKGRLLPVYTRSRSGLPGEFEVCIFCVDQELSELSVHLHLVGNAEKPWTPISKLPMSGDTRLSCIYVPGKPEPLLMAGSPTERVQKLCHLNLVEWCDARRDGHPGAPPVPLVEEKFSRRMATLWPEHREGHDGEATIAVPIDCTADLPVSRHGWVLSQIPHGGAPVLGHPDPLRPPFEYPPPFGPPPPMMDPRGPPPPFDFRPRHGPPPPCDGFDPRQGPYSRPPPFERPPPPGPWFGRPPLDRPPFDFNDHRPPLDPAGERRAILDAEGGPRPPFEAPPGEWFGNSAALGAPPMPPPPPGAMEEPRERRHRHRRRSSIGGDAADGQPALEGEEGHKRKHRHRHRNKNGEGDGEAEGNDGGGERKHRRRRRHRGEAGEAAEAEAEAEAEVEAGGAAQDPSSAPDRPRSLQNQDQQDNQEGEGEKRRHHHHHRRRHHHHHHHAREPEAEGARLELREPEEPDPGAPPGDS